MDFGQATCSRHFAGIAPALDAFSVGRIYMAFRDERRPTGAMQTSLFRTASTVEQGPPVPEEQGWRGRAAGEKRR